MTEDDQFAEFKRASTALSAKVELLHAQVASLDNVNSEVIMYTDKNGILPDISNRSFGWTSQNLLEDQFFTTSFTSVETPANEINVCERPCESQSDDLTSQPNALIQNDINKNISNLCDLRDVNLSIVNSSLSTQTNTLSRTFSEFVMQHTRELNVALAGLNVAPSKRERFLRETEEKLCSLLLSSDDELQSAGTVINSVVSIDDSPAMEAGKHFSCYLSPTLGPHESETISTDPYPCNTFFSIAQQAEADKSTALIEVLPGKTKPSISLPTSASTLSEVSYRRRQELVRANNRLHSLQQPSEAFDTVNAGVDVDPPKMAFSTAIHAQLVDRKPTLMLQSIDGIDRALLGTQSQNKDVPSAVDDGTDPRVIRGFTRLAALFRGHFVRLVFNTQKVSDLIRLIKDTAQLALSIHLDLEAAATRPHAPATGDPRGGELLLQSRLLAQLHDALSQLHDIFFTWDFSKQLSLVATSRRIPQIVRNGSTPRRSLKSSNLPSEASQEQSAQISDDCAENCHPSSPPPRRATPLTASLSQPVSRNRSCNDNGDNREATELAAECPQTRLRESLDLTKAFLHPMVEFTSPLYYKRHRCSVSYSPTRPIGSAHHPLPTSLVNKTRMQRKQFPVSVLIALSSGSRPSPSTSQRMSVPDQRGHNSTRPVRSYASRSQTVSTPTLLPSTAPVEHTTLPAHIPPPKIERPPTTAYAKTCNQPQQVAGGRALLAHLLSQRIRLERQQEPQCNPRHIQPTTTCGHHRSVNQSNLTLTSNLKPVQPEVCRRRTLSHANLHDMATTLNSNQRVSLPSGLHYPPLRRFATIAGLARYRDVRIAHQFNLNANTTLTLKLCPPYRPLPVPPTSISCQHLESQHTNLSDLCPPVMLQPDRQADTKSRHIDRVVISSTSRQGRGQWYPVKQRIVARKPKAVGHHPIPSTHSPVSNYESNTATPVPALKATWSLESGIFQVPTAAGDDRCVRTSVAEH